jgi:small-conductance mechanosensitive channel
MWQSAFTDLAARAIAYVPTLLLALVILLVGWALARLLAALARRLARRLGLDGAVERGGLAEGLAQALGKVAQAAVASMGVEFHEGIGRGVRGLLLVITTVLAVEQLGLNLTFLTDALTNLLTIVVAGLALAFGLGGRDVVRNVLAGYYARDQFAPGEGLVVDGEVGTLESIGTVNTQIGLGEEVLVVPNSSLTEGTVRV